jgi:adenosylcobinamide kinase/adenosylcobinamide-phosphate guanylyltransferase
MNSHTLTLVTGGSRSGKSRWALEKILGYPRKFFLATAVATDQEMERRIARHQEERAPDFATIEEPVSLARALREKAPFADAILVDCLTFWLNNLFHYFGDGSQKISARILQEIDEFFKVLDTRPTSLILVTNEINMGVIPADRPSRHFVEEQGRLNQEVARRADEVIFMVAGIPQVLKKNLFPSESLL